MWISAITPNDAAGYGIQLKHDGQRRTAFDLLSYPTLAIADIAEVNRGEFDFRWGSRVNFNQRISEESEMSGFVITFTDITERKHAERTLQDTEERFRLIARQTGGRQFAIVAMSNLFGQPGTQWSASGLGIFA